MRGSPHQQPDDPTCPQVTYRPGASGRLVPMLRGTAIRVQTVVVAAQRWKMEPRQLAREYGISEDQAHAAFAFYAAHGLEMTVPSLTRRHWRWRVCMAKQCLHVDSVR